MNGNCFEIGTIQAFLDGELASDKSVCLTDHIVDCDACARLMAEAEEENSVVFSALERELNTLVPTQRLWLRINESIEVEKSRAPFWQKALAYVRLSLQNPSIVAAAGLILVVGLFAVIWMPKGVENTTAGNGSQPPVVGPTSSTVTNPEPAPVVASSVTPDEKAPKAYKADQSNLSPQEIRKQIVTAELRKQGPSVPTPQNAEFLRGEESYMKTIADLKQNVDAQKDTVFTPSTRVSYERDMAVVNDSIKRMRDVVKKNPRNQAARQVLYSSYQDKIDLLNSVAQREELMASLK
ncbi:MAG TPA: hypothetical protein VJV05_04035 [Pyrinomonadaceae bacterium]|nr:hypothetical protein [Pyrinomonadaceae bacterium]